ncbi:hypothetical protein CSOJ01_00755 [Colletotrichum sojae]|uniref:Uncharacterized protein n=1 Tax=Colletotrichum sojae TaxID=2175907 RepID=A0A8H6JWA7_9PEZI|nr:hypothetical protein CSOJ01_00755 [Colletotrichum sojae]
MSCRLQKREHPLPCTGSLSLSPKNTRRFAVLEAIERSIWPHRTALRQSGPRDSLWSEKQRKKNKNYRPTGLVLQLQAAEHSCDSSHAFPDPPELDEVPNGPPECANAEGKTSRSRWISPMEHLVWIATFKSIWGQEGSNGQTSDGSAVPSMQECDTHYPELSETPTPAPRRSSSATSSSAWARRMVVVAVVAVAETGEVQVKGPGPGPGPGQDRDDEQPSSTSPDRPAPLAEFSALGQVVRVHADCCPPVARPDIIRMPGKGCLESWVRLDPGRETRRWPLPSLPLLRPAFKWPSR